MVSRFVQIILIAVTTFSALFAQTALPPIPAQAETLTPERRGDIYMARKMYREAIDVYRQSPQHSPIIVNKMGIAYHQMVQLDAARKLYERAIKLNPKYSEAINNLGTVHYAKRNYRRAVSQYNRALQLSPKSASIYSNLGTAQFARKKYKEAYDSYQMALSLDPEVFEHRGTYGTMLQERSVEEKAKFHYYLAKTYANAGQFERALQYLRMAFEEGFKERQKLLEEPEFAKLRELAEFQALMATQPRVL
ncbi:MAG: tetratricopeptide repeat protein [Bryobacteraceae bacterium]